MNYLDKVYERLKLNYEECDINYSLGKITVNFESAKILVYVNSVEFEEDGQETQKISLSNDDDIYEVVEQFILYMQDGGIAQTQSETEKMKLNSTYDFAVTTCKKKEKPLIIILWIIKIAILILALKFGGGLLWISLFIGFVLLSNVIVYFVEKRYISKYWVCPHCSKPLPVVDSHFSINMKYVTKCPHCNKVLQNKQAKVKAVSKKLEIEEDTYEEKTVKKPKKKTSKKSTNKKSNSKTKLPSIIVGSIMIFQNILLYMMCMVNEITTTSVRLFCGIGLSIVTLILAIILMAYPIHKINDDFKPVIVVKERPFISILGGILVVFGIILTFTASFGIISEPSYAMFFFLSVIGIGLILLGMWALLSRINRKLIIYNNDTLIYTNCFGKTKEFQKEQIEYVKFGTKQNLNLIDENNKKLFTLELNMEGIDQFIDWLEDTDVDVTLTKTMEHQLENSVDNGATKQWREEYRTPLHKNIKLIRVGLILVTVLFVLGSVLPFPMYIYGNFKFSHIVYMLGFSVLPLTIYYLIFAPVIVIGAKPKDATKEWKSMHISIPIWILIILALWVVSIFYYGFNSLVLTVVDVWKFVLLCALISSLFITFIVLRTPKRLRNEGMLALCAVILLFSYPLGYAFNLSLSGKTQHYDADIIERKVEQSSDEDDKDDDKLDYSFVVRLDDKTKKEIEVSPQLFFLERAGEDIVVCQKESILGIRMVKVHIKDKDN